MGDTEEARDLVLEYRQSSILHKLTRSVDSSSKSYSLMAVVVPSCPRLDCQWRDGASDGSHLRFSTAGSEPSPGHAQPPNGSAGHRLQHRVWGDSIYSHNN